MVDHRLKAYLGSGPVADRPATPDTQPGVLVIWRDPETHELTFWNTETVAWETDPTILADAPVDGMFYTRKDGAWVGFEVPDLPAPPADDGKLYGIADGIWTEILFPVIPTVDVQEAPEDGDSYMRKDGDWFKYVPPEIPELPDNLVTEAPEDGEQYVRSNGAWVPVEIPDGAGFPEAPQDGKIYGRKDGAWAEILIDDSSPGDGGTLPPETPGQMAHKYWRVYCRANNGDGYTGLTEVYFRDVAGVEFPPTDGVIIKSGEAPNGAIGYAVQAFDRVLTNRWEVPIAVGAWIGIQYATAVKVRRLSLTSGNQYPAQMMKNFDIQWSDDGITWTTRWSHDNITAWGTSETRNFADPVEDPVSTAIPSPTGKAGKVLAVAASGRELVWSDAGGVSYPRFRYMRIQKIVNYGDGASAREVYFRKGGVDLPKPTILSDNSSSEYPFSKAINGLLTDFWSTYGVGANVIVNLDFGTLVEMDQFVWLSRTDSYQQAPASFEMLLSADGKVFSAPLIVTYDLAGWTVGGATRTVTLPKNSPAAVNTTPGIAGAPLIVQFAHARGNGGATATLANAPTAGNTLLFVNSGFSSGKTSPGARFRAIADYSTQNQRITIWAAKARGDEGINFTSNGGDWNNCSIYEIEGGEAWLTATRDLGSFANSYDLFNKLAGSDCLFFQFIESDGASVFTPADGLPSLEVKQMNTPAGNHYAMHRVLVSSKAVALEVNTTSPINMCEVVVVMGR